MRIAIFLNMTTYSEHVEYLESVLGYTREHIILTEKNTVSLHNNTEKNTVSLHNNTEDSLIIDVECPKDQRIVMMGKNAEDGKYDIEDYTLSLYITDKNENEIPENTKLIFALYSCLCGVNQLAVIRYSDVRIGTNFTFDHSWELPSEGHFEVYKIWDYNYRFIIPTSNIKFKMNVDIFKVKE